MLCCVIKKNYLIRWRKKTCYNFATTFLSFSSFFSCSHSLEQMTHCPHYIATSNRIKFHVSAKLWHSYSSWTPKRNKVSRKSRQSTHQTMSIQKEREKEVCMHILVLHNRAHIFTCWCRSRLALNANWDEPIASSRTWKRSKQLTAKEKNWTRLSIHLHAFRAGSLIARHTHCLWGTSTKFSSAVIRC